MSIWTPAGNKVQTDIDIHIAKLEHLLSRLFMDVSYTRKDIAKLEDYMYDLNICLSHMKLKGIIVSVSEYDLVKKQHTYSLVTERHLTGKLTALETKITEAEAEIEVLKELRRQSETKVLEFPINVNSKKRS